ncbi:MAG: hypothetical protein B7733_24875 [Myxococcales bacterium FL481]|nr:MAG: hypothetical protein B7733_24875 [Myxococcales bacterium FL481]
MIALSLAWPLPVWPAAVVEEPRCASDEQKRHFETGRRQGDYLVVATWASLQQECARLDELAHAVGTLIERASTSGATPNLLCRHRGFVEGAHESLDRISTSSCSTPHG